MNNMVKKRASLRDKERRDGKREGGVKSTLIKFTRIIQHHCGVHKHTQNSD